MIQFTEEERSFYKKVMMLVLPMAIQNLINVGITSSDVIMLGRVGEDVLSGVSLAGQIQFIMQLIFFGITSGAAVLTAQYWGKRDTEAIEKVLGMTLKFGIVISFGFTLVATLIPETLMRIFSSEKQVIAHGTDYLRMICISYMISAVTMIYLNIMRSIERVKISTLVYGVAFGSNVIFNYILIFGVGPFPALGARGAAIGTLLARCLELMIVVIHSVKFNPDVKVSFKSFWHTDALLLSDFVKFSLPVVFNELMWGLGMSAFSAILGHLGSPVSAAYSVASVTRQLAMVVCLGVANATAIMIGKTIGEGKLDLAKEYGRRFKNLSILFGIIGGVLVLILRPIILNFMSVSELSRHYMNLMLIIISYYVIAQSLNTTVIVGVLRAGGDTKYGAYVDIFGMWCFSIFLGFLAAYVFHLPVEVVILILLSDEIIKVPMSLWRYYKYKWLMDVTR